MASGKRTDATVLVDSIGYFDEDGERHDAEKGETVSLAERDFERHLAAGNIAKPSSGGTAEGGWPRKHAELDELAAANGVTFEADAKVDDKIAALEAAGVEPPAGE